MENINGKDIQVNLKDRVAVVTGGSGALCSAIAKGLASSGAKVAIVARTKEKIQLVVDEITEMGYIAEGFYCDVTDKKSIESANEEIKKVFGTCDILVNGAGGIIKGSITTMDNYDSEKGINQGGCFWDIEEATVRASMDLNYMGTLLPMQVFSRDMAEKQRGCIINISSVAGLLPLTKVVSYSNGKSAITNLTKWAAVHFAGTGIRCNAIVPGFYAAEQNHDMLFNPDGTPTPRSEKILKGTPMNRFGQPQDLVGLALFLASDSASFVTGTAIPVDGGFMAYSGV